MVSTRTLARLALAGFFSIAISRPLQAQQGCDPRLNPIVCENALAGNDPAEWDITGAGDPTLQGFATEISVNKGETIHFKIDTTASAFDITIYRLGFYGGSGARRVATLANISGTSQPACLTETDTGLVDCGNWSESAAWSVPATAVSGIYIARLSQASGGASHIPFVVRDDQGQSDILMQTSDTTWHAYNTYGGHSLYAGGPGVNPARAYKVSYNRPITTRGTTPEDFLFSAEYPMLRWLEANGFDVSYASGVDVDRDASLIANHRVFATAGHDEYWSGDQRAHVEAARGAGVNLAFFSGNDMFWKTRWESSIDGSGAPYRTLVCYKETHANGPIDPLDPPVWTGTWMDPRFSPPGDGGRPQNAITGTLFTVNGGSPGSSTWAISVPQSVAAQPFWRNTRVAALAPGETATLAPGTLGYEWNANVTNGVQPLGLIQLSATTFSNASTLQDYGSTYALSTATHAMTLYRHSSGALVFSAGTVFYAWGLDGTHDYSAVASTTDPAMQQATINLLSDMGVQPGSMQAGLVTGSSDTVPPAISVSSPVDGASVSGRITVSAGATDDTTVASVQFKLDGVSLGSSITSEPFNVAWDTTAVSDGAHSLYAVARDASGNAAISATTTVRVMNSGLVCPCTILAPFAAPDATAPDPNPVELGVKFRSDVNGSLTGLRFYKDAANGGTHVGHLWSSSGALLGSVTFTNESTSGWQEARFASPIPVSPNTTYVASYHTDSGFYALTEPAFSDGIDATPLHALADGTGGGNGVYAYGASTFPTQTWDASNYWVDVVFEDGSGPDTTPPTVGITAPVANTGVSGTVTVAASAADNVAVAGVQFFVDGTAIAAEDTSSPYATTWNTTAVANGSHTLTAVARDASGNMTSAAITVAVSNVTPGDVCPCSLWSDATIPGAMVPDPSAVELGLKVQSDIDGFVTGLRFYKYASNTGTHVGHLWTSAGSLIGTVTFSNETPSGWQQAAFPAPIPIGANTTYVASYHTDTGNYALTEPAFTLGTDAIPLHALASGASGGNGVYAYGGDAFPDQTWDASNYWVDIVFDTVASGDSTPPTVALTAPAADSTVSGTITVLASAADNTAVAGVQLLLDGAALGAEMTATPYGTTWNTSTATNGPHTLAAVARDASGNTANTTISVTVANTSTGGCPCSLWNPSSGGGAAAPDGNAVEVGVKIQSDLDGYVTGLRFYKSASNTGTHVGHLWSSTGTLLGTLTFASETVSGWQQATFASPIPITANTIYVASYHTDTGFYNYTEPGFSSSVDAAPIHALSDASSGGNGVYAYGPSSFPRQTWDATNYWVDVVFVTTP